MSAIDRLSSDASLLEQVRRPTSLDLPSDEAGRRHQVASDLLLAPIGGLSTEPMYGSPELNPIARIEAPHLDAQPSLVAFAIAKNPGRHRRKALPVLNLWCPRERRFA
jgi:hypothetical protein